jgi:hypothetical protein
MPWETAEQFGHHRGHRGAARQHVVVAAVGGERVIVGVHRLRHAGRDRLLAGAEVRRPLDQVLQEQVVRALLELPEFGHLPVHLERGVSVYGSVYFWHVIAFGFVSRGW